MAQETEHLTQLQRQVGESDREVKANKAIEKEYTDKKVNCSQVSGHDY